MTPGRWRRWLDHLRATLTPADPTKEPFGLCGSCLMRPSTMQVQASESWHGGYFIRTQGLCAVCAAAAGIQPPPNH